MSESQHGAANYKKKSNHYIDKKEFYEEMKAFKKDPENIRRVENGERPNIPNCIAEKILLLCERHSYNWKFGDRFPFRDEMVLDAVENCIRYIWNFNEDKYDNPFGYFNRTIHQEFIKRIKKEKKDFEKRVKYVQNLGIMEEYMDNAVMTDDTMDSTKAREIQENLQKFMDYEIKETPKKKKEKEDKGLDKFTETEKESS